MDKEKASYILKFFPRLLNENESKAFRHYSSAIKLNNSSNNENAERARQFYIEKGWLSEDHKVLELLNEGYDHFESSVADRINSEFHDKIFFNTCPKCGRLARTPQAKQCRFCGHRWHEEIAATFQLLSAFQVIGRQFYLVGELLSGKIEVGMKVDLTILGIGQKPEIEAIEFALHREENTSWEDIGLGVSSLDETGINYLKSHTPFSAPLLIEK